MSDRPQHPVGTAGTVRIEALTDGLYAIIMTLLVFDIKLPQVPPQELPAAVVALWPSFIGYFVSFVVLGIYWIGHRAQFRFIEHSDQNLYWINMLFFALSGLIPFSTGLVSQYYQQWFAVAFYGVNLSLIGLALYLHWFYATHKTRLVAPDISPVAVRYGTQRCLLAPAGYMLAVLLGLINPFISLLVYAFVPLFYIVPSLQRVWLHLAQRSA